MATDIDGNHILEAEVPLKIREDKWGHKTCQSHQPGQIHVALAESQIAKNQACAGLKKKSDSCHALSQAMTG